MTTMNLVSKCIVVVVLFFLNKHENFAVGPTRLTTLENSFITVRVFVPSDSVPI